MKHGQRIRSIARKNDLKVSVNGNEVLLITGDKKKFQELLPRFQELLAGVPASTPKAAKKEEPAKVDFTKAAMKVLGQFKEMLPEFPKAAKGVKGAGGFKGKVSSVNHESKEIQLSLAWPTVFMDPSTDPSKEATIFIGQINKWQNRLTKEVIKPLEKLGYTVAI